MKKRDDDKRREEGKVEEREVLGRSSNSKVRCKGELILLAPLKRGGPAETATCTPVLPWKHQHQGGGIAVVGGAFNGGGTQQPSSFSSLFLPPSPAPIPARRLAAAVWEFLQYFSPPEAMQSGDDADDLRVRLHQRRRRDHHHHYLHHRLQQEKGNGGFDDQVNLGGPSHRSPEHQSPTASSLRHQVAVLLAQHHRSSARNHLPPQPPSPASYGSSLEINAYNQASTPTGSIDLKGGRIGEPSSFGFKTSTELLKVLNRIWTLEEQHVSNLSLVKDMKTELNNARVRIKELLRDQQSSRHEIDDLMKQVAKNKEQERSIHATVNSLKNELEDERKLRKRSEGLHRRLAREIFEVKVALSSSLKEVERERTGRCLLENLCDEFAKGIIEYEREAHVLRQKNEKNLSGASDRVIIQMCESWLDERFQMKDQEDAPQEMVVDKIRDEIENFLQSQKGVDSKERRFRRNSLESFPLNDVGSAPRYMGNGDSINTKNELSERKSAVDQEKGVTEIDKPVSELLLSEGKAAMLESSSKNSLKAKLQEPKTRVGYRSRLKILKGSS